MYLYFLLFLSTCVGISNYYHQAKIESIEHKKMYNIIMNKGSIDKDIYKRTISDDVVKIFCDIAKKYTINLDTISDHEFDKIYKKYLKYVIDKANKI
jgi:spore coat protein CotF